ncbi:MAG TPA: heme exporter protein CcmD [Rhizomicrobium sp.]|nr:heme exporter protein CcmD [Rhizomicrobium sp.]
MSFWQMGGYGEFIWPAYGVSALGLAVAIIWTLAAYNQAKKRLKLLEERKT